MMKVSVAFSIALLALSISPAHAMKTDAEQKEEQEDSASFLPQQSTPPQTQSQINETVVKTATRVYESINTHWTYVPAGPDQKMWTESSSWKPQWIQSESWVAGKKTAIKLPTLVLKEPIANLMESLEDLIQRSAALECTIALTTVKIFCLREILGEKDFNFYAKEFYDILKQDKKLDVTQFFHELPEQFLNCIKGPAIPGSTTYITNIPLYAHFKPTGNGRGINVVCVKPNQYIGFGEIYQAGPQSIETIEQRDCLLFTRKEDVEKNHEQHAKISDTFQREPQKFIDMRRKAQEQSHFHQIFDAEEFATFAATKRIYPLESDEAATASSEGRG